MVDHGAKIIDWLSQLKSSYGFVPALMTVGTIVVAIAALSAPAAWGAAIASFLGLPPAPDAEAMRDLMSLIAGATIGTGAVAFSVIVAASINAAGQYGPRLLTNFLADRATQITLGVFVSSFVYAILVYAAIREDAGGDVSIYGLAGMIGMTYALGSVAALIFFLHHAPSALRINQAISKIGESLLRNVSTRFPANCAFAVNEMDMAAARRTYDARADAVPLRANQAGLVSIIDGGKLCEAAARVGALVTLRIRPGVFQVPGQVIADIHFGDGKGAQLSDEALGELRSAFAIAKLRTPSQDNEFLADELTEIALRALSPGINDPFTAIACMEWLAAALGEVARTDDPVPYRRHEDGDFRLYAEPIDFAAYLQGTLSRIRQVSAANVRAAEGHMRSLALAAVGAAENKEAMRLIRDEARALVAQAELALAGPDLAAVHDAAERFEAALASTPPALDKLR
ncbi:DUF2254 domain-containing protein [Pacificimonas sp. WHA3]|uniref:DUF2254 domain-containing protein n=1 Tax=Pacificimonas pallii TaxID=2827236 RepID=A0ABS6SCH8_9SPHN|nr:DUF2254 domain-containing protein [Pacificimonas pallii]MBV7255930.1 DUF2254 domain-containing protein [Pacificimonas pallii]